MTSLARNWTNTKFMTCLFLAVMVAALFQLTAASHSLRAYASTVPRNSDNCDSSSTCIDIAAKVGRGSSQYNNCHRFSSCSNFAGASFVHQYNDCGTSDCNNAIRNPGLRFFFDTQTNNCQLSRCMNNIASGGLDNQNIACQSSTCQNHISSSNSNNQNTACQSSICTNSGVNTNVYSNSAPSCPSGADDTTTVCQKDRSFTFSNH
jgi:hypothetical protein